MPEICKRVMLDPLANSGRSVVVNSRILSARILDIPARYNALALYCGNAIFLYLGAPRARSDFPKQMISTISPARKNVDQIPSTDH